MPLRNAVGGHYEAVADDEPRALTKASDDAPVEPFGQPSAQVIRVGWARLDRVLAGEDPAWQWDEMEHDCRAVALPIVYGLLPDGPSPDNDFVVGGCMPMGPHHECRICGCRW